MQQFDMLNKKVFTVIKTKMKKALSTKYPDISFDDEPTINEPSFPNVFYLPLESLELGRTLQGNSITALLHTVQIIVTTNTNKSDAETVAYSAVDALKSLRYEIVGMPLYDIQIKEKSRIHSFKIRASRPIGSGDLL